MQAAILAWGKEKSKFWMRVLNDHWVGPTRHYLGGAEPTIADYFGIALTTAGELIHCDLSAFPNVQRWIGNMKARPSYAKVYEAFNGMVQSTKGQNFERL